MYFMYSVKCLVCVLFSGLVLVWVHVACAQYINIVEIIHAVKQRKEKYSSQDPFADLDEDEVTILDDLVTLMIKTLMIKTLMIKTLMIKTLMIKTLMIRTLMIKTLMIKTLMVKTLMIRTLMIKTLMIKTLMVKTLMIKTLMIKS